MVWEAAIPPSKAAQAAAPSPPIFLYNILPYTDEDLSGDVLGPEDPEDRPGIYGERMDASL